MPIALVLLLALQQPTAQPPARPPTTTQTPARPPATTQAPAQPGTATPAAPRRPTPTTATLEVRVVDRSGRPVDDAHVVLQGPTSREDKSDKNGSVTLKTLPAGNYRVRAESTGYIALEKEISLKGAVAPTEVLLSLSAAPVAPPPEPKKEAPPPPPPPPAPVATMGTPGEPRSLSIPDLAERSLSGRDPLKVFPIGCSGASQSRLIVLRDAIPPGTNKDADETLYLVAGEATLTLGSAKEQPITPGWFTIVPRGTSYALGRKGRNPAILLSTVSGRPCGAAGGANQ
jgi:mannose-6-phosphate isomerase-like protein (cupin superfamily)